jgi:hypothetical protein
MFQSATNFVRISRSPDGTELQWKEKEVCISIYYEKTLKFITVVVFY